MRAVMTTLGSLMSVVLVVGIATGAIGLLASVIYGGAAIGIIALGSTDYEELF